MLRPAVTETTLPVPVPVLPQHSTYDVLCGTTARHARPPTVTRVGPHSTSPSPIIAKSVSVSEQFVSAGAPSRAAHRGPRGTGARSTGLPTQDRRVEGIGGAVDRDHRDVEAGGRDGPGREPRMVTDQHRRADALDVHALVVAALPPCWTRGRGSAAFGQIVIAALPRFRNMRTVISCRWDTGGDGHRRFMARRLDASGFGGRRPTKLAWRLNDSSWKGTRCHLFVGVRSVEVRSERRPALFCIQHQGQRYPDGRSPTCTEHSNGLMLPPDVMHNQEAALRCHATTGVARAVLAGC